MLHLSQGEEQFGKYFPRLLVLTLSRERKESRDKIFSKSTKEHIELSLTKGWMFSEMSKGESAYLMTVQYWNLDHLFCRPQAAVLYLTVLF